jgi:hypothetical protein
MTKLKFRVIFVRILKNTLHFLQKMQERKNSKNKIEF